MFESQDPSWLRFLSRRLQWLGIPNIAAVFVGLQVLGFFFVYSNPGGIEHLALIPSLVLRGEVWRLVSFLGIPLSMSPLWMIFALWFEYFILNAIESQWGDFKTTFYIIMSLVLTILFSMFFDYPITGLSDFTSTLFLAAAALFPEFEIQIYFLIPVKMKYLG